MYRGKYLQGYIDFSLEVIENGDDSMAEKFHDVIISVFENEIETVFDRTSAAAKAGGHVDYIEELKYLRGELQGFLNKLEDNERVRVLNEEIDRIRKLNPGAVMILDKDSMKTTPEAAKFKTALANVRNLTDRELDPEDKKVLKGRLAALELSRRNKDKDSIEQKLRDILEFISYRNIKVSLCVLPYIGEATKSIRGILNSKNIRSKYIDN